MLLQKQKTKGIHDDVYVQEFGQKKKKKKSK